MLDRLAEPETGVNDDSILFYADFQTFFHRVTQSGQDIAHHIAINRVFLHGQRSCAHVHENDGGPGIAHGL